VSHPLHDDEAHRERPLGTYTDGKGRAFSQVEHRRSLATGSQLVVIEGAVFVGKNDTLVAELPERLTVVGPDGKTIKPSRGHRFVITTSTFDPYHAVAEVPT
jgi:hypothetical protein